MGPEIADDAQQAVGLAAGRNGLALFPESSNIYLGTTPSLVAVGLSKATLG